MEMGCVYVYRKHSLHDEVVVLAQGLVVPKPASIRVATTVASQMGNGAELMGRATVELLLGGGGGCRCRGAVPAGGPGAATQGESTIIWAECIRVAPR